MSRVKSGKISKKRHKKILKLAKGYRGRANSCFSVAIQKVEKALQYSYRDRRNKKRSFRGLWIQRINAAVRTHGLIYSQFVDKLNKANIQINRKLLAELAVNNSTAFSGIIDRITSI